MFLIYLMYKIVVIPIKIKKDIANLKLTKTKSEKI